MASYPILFGYRDLVAGNGYYAGVKADGRALLVDEQGGSWVYGVNPGGLAAGGHDNSSATAAFRAAYRSVLFDFAAEAENFDDFKRRAEAFFRETNEPTEKEWLAAVEKVRAGKVDLDWLERRPAESAHGMRIVEVTSPTADQNELDPGEAIARVA